MISAEGSRIVATINYRACLVYSNQSILMKEIKKVLLHAVKHRVFWLNIAKFEVNLCYRYCSNLFRNLRKESEFRQYHCRNSTKVGERKRKSGREKFLIFGNTITEIPSAHTCCLSGCSKCECVQGKPNVAMALPK